MVYLIKENMNYTPNFQQKYRLISPYFSFSFLKHFHRPTLINLSDLPFSTRKQCQFDQSDIGLDAVAISQNFFVNPFFFRSKS